MTKKILLSILFLALYLYSASQGTSNPCRKSTEGTDFWFGFMESRNYHSNHYVEITVTAREATTFTITIGNEEQPFQGTYSVEANNSRQIKIPWDMVEAIGSEKIENKGIHLVSEKPVNLYALNYDRNSADVAVIYPTESLGKEYFAMCYDVNIHENNGNYGNGRNSEFLVVATEDSTNVLIIPSKVTDQLKNAGDSITVVLNKGEVFQVQSKNRNNLSGQGDLTQSYIKSDKPVAFYSGSLGTTVPATSGISAWDHLYEQIPPVHSWGREYYTAPLKSRAEDRYRIIAANDNTTVNITNKKSITLNKGDFEEIVLYSNEPSRIFADKPIMVAQYSQSNKVDGTGDPFMIILSSITQSKNDVTFVAYDSDIIQNYYVNIICLSDQVNNLRFDGNSIGSSFKPFPEGGYSYAQMSISSGTHRIYNTNEDRGFLAYVYGYGGVESYGYGVGFNLDLVLDLGESINFNGDTLLLCHGDSRILDSGPYFDTYNWNTGDTTQTLTINSGGKYFVKTTTIDGCELEDSIFVFVSHPEVDLGIENDEGCSPYKIDLDAGKGFEKYIWQNHNKDTLSTNQIFTANSTNEYALTVYDEYNCPARDTMNLVVFPVPKVVIQADKLVCGTKNAELNVDISDAPESVWNFPGSFSWSSNHSNLLFSKESHQEVEVTVSDWGEYQVFYELNTSDGCYSSDTFTINFQPIPTSKFNFVESPDDKCKDYTREVLYTGNATQSANFYWDYGGAKVIDSIDWNRFTVSLGAYNTNPYISLFVEENGCWSKDTTSSLLGANPDFVLQTGKARGCDSMSVLFQGELKVPDALLFEWDFGDGSAISNKQEVLHFYADTGFYDVGLTITNTLSGCQIGFQIDSMIKVFPTPTAEITADISTCHPDSARLVYTNSIDSSNCTWSFEGGRQSGEGNDTIIMILDEPISKAILEVEEFGCTSAPIDVALKRKPHFDFFTDKTEGCQPYLLEVTADPTDDLLDFTWLTDSLPFPTGNSAMYFFPDSGRMNVSLMATSQETGCSDTLLKENWIWVHPKPVASFEVDYPVALLEHPDITFTNLSTSADYFLWDFGDDQTSNETNPMHTYTQLGEYSSKLFAESVFGCKDTSQFEIKILPFSVFTPNAFRPDSDIPENRTFMPVGIGADASRFNFKVFDRWGQVMFESNTPEHHWKGTNKKGEPAPMGNYVWISHYYDIQGFEHNQKGQVLLIR